MKCTKLVQDHIRKEVETILFAKAGDLETELKNLKNKEQAERETLEQSAVVCVKSIFNDMGLTAVDCWNKVCNITSLSLPRYTSDIKKQIAKIEQKISDTRRLAEIKANEIIVKIQLGGDIHTLESMLKDLRES